MKRLLFVMPSLKNGGMTTAFLSLLSEIIHDKNLKIDVLLLDDEFKNKLPCEVNILPTNKFLKLPVMSQKQVFSDSKLLGVLRLVLGFYVSIFNDTLVYKLLMLTYKKLEGYDCAISYAQTASCHSLYGGSNEFVLNKVKANKKITFIHCDYVNAGLNTKHNSKIYSKFNKIAAVSDGVKNVFVGEEPNLINKVYTVHNCHNYNMIKELSQRGTLVYDNKCINILTVARLSEEKGHIRMLNVLTELKNEGYKFVWHVVGGADKSIEEKFINMVKKNEMKNYVSFYHNTDNPYRFFPNADIMLLASFHEAAPMVFSEAECLKIPVITTDTLSAKEFISDKGIGIICDNNEKGLYDTLKMIFTDKQLLHKLKQYIKCVPVPTNKDALNEFYAIIND